MWFAVVNVKRTLVRFTVTVIADVVWNKMGPENENGGTRFSATMFLSDNIKDIVFKRHSMQESVAQTSQEKRLRAHMRGSTEKN